MERLNYKSAGATRNRPERETYVSSASRAFAPGNFVTSGTTNTIGVTLAIRDQSEANPMVLVEWVTDQTPEWIRSEYLYLAGNLVVTGEHSTWNISTQ